MCGLSKPTVFKEVASRTVSHATRIRPTRKKPHPPENIDITSPDNYTGREIEREKLGPSPLWGLNNDGGTMTTDPRPRIPHSRSLPAIAFILTLLALTASCSTPTPKPKASPMGKAEKQAIRSRVTTIAVFPVTVPSTVTDPDPVIAEYETLIEAKLRDCGFQVINPEQFSDLRKQTQQEVGGWYDPVTGQRDDVKFNTYMTRVCDALTNQFKADAFLFPHIVTRMVHYGGGSWVGVTAHWDGASEKLIKGGDQVLEGFMGTIHQGTIRAFSLATVLEDGTRLKLFSTYGGIQLEDRLSGPGLGSSFTVQPRSALFSDTNRNHGAVDIALSPLCN